MLYDLLSHHRLKVISKAGRTFPGKREAQKMVATRLFRYTRMQTGEHTVAGVVGEAFAAADTGMTFGGSVLRQLEAGGPISSGGFMLIPVGRGAELARSGIKGRRRQFADLIAGRRLELIVRPGKPALLVQHVAGRGTKERGRRDVIMAVLARRRTQRPLLEFYRSFDEVQSSDAPKFEKAMDLAATAAGQSTLLERIDRQRSGAAASIAAYRAYIAANPGNNAEARRVAMAASKAARGQIRSLGGVE
jgi:hypothetical protein